MYHYQINGHRKQQITAHPLIRLKPQRPTLLPHLLPPNLHRHNKQIRRKADRSLDPKALLRALRLGPCDLEVANDEAAGGAGEVDPGRLGGVSFKLCMGRGGEGTDHFAAAFGVAV